jgi:hypothetical protein
MPRALAFLARSALTLAACLAVAPAALAQAPAAPDPARVLILGTYHFANPGLDVIQTQVADVLAPAKQAEIAAVVEALSRFRPTRVVVEQLPSTAPGLDSLFAAYREGRHTLGRNETEQLGFRLAAAHGLAGVHPFDHRGEFPFGPVMEYAQRHDPAFVQMVQREMARITEESNREQREMTVGQILRAANHPEQLAAAHGMYLRFARVGAGDTQVGAELLARWYERNIRMFSNLQAVVRPGDRVLVITGSGHAPILRELVGYDPEMELVEANDYLP